MKLKYGFSTTTRRCIPVVDESKFSIECKAMLGIPHLKMLLNSSHPWEIFILLVGVFRGQVDGGEVPI